MSSIALYTWCYDIGRTNYGQLLQCYATQKKIQHMGQEVELIRYRNPQENMDAVTFLASDRNKYELEYRVNSVEGGMSARVSKFISFIKKRINCTNVLYSIEEVEEAVKDVDIMLLGSDQLWASQWFDEITLFGFASNKKKVSYATSGLTNTSKKDRITNDRIACGLKYFDGVSVRENYGKEILNQLSKDLIVNEVIDPTLLLSSDEWSEVASCIQEDNDYVLCYFLGKFSEKKIVARGIMKRFKASKVLYIKSNYFEEGIVSEDVFFEAKDIGPEDFLTLIKNAKAVYTDSYHGCLFSIIFKKQFFVARYVNPGRIEDICKKLNISDRKSNSLRELNLTSDIEYDDVYNQLGGWLEVSTNFLKEYLSY